MTAHIDFGDRVNVGHELRPVYVIWKTTERVSRPNSGGGFMLCDEVEVPGHLAAAGESDDPDIGLPLPDPSGDPSRKGQVARRLRRFPADAAGVVVGRTYRIEGDYHAGSPHSVNYFGESDYEQASLTESRRIQVYEVAIGESWPDLTAWPARIALAITDDLEVR